MSGTAELVLPGVVKGRPLQVEHRVPVVGHGLDQVAEEVAGHAGRGLLVQLDKGELGRAVRKTTLTASSSAESTVEPGAVGPVGRSATAVRFFHWAAVFGLIP